ncbi:MAG: succinylglutamate desuccinylase/aspartoacylase family protein, partial [Bacteroidia bacterium]|nr:succinylglutamate desuccinylase/aspartoacylase family protein [Bacteroidia bacterium]
MSDRIVINGTNVDPGEHKKVIFSQCELPSQSVIETPAFVFRSANAGPVVLLSAGMHGEETNGIETMRQLIKRSDIQNPLCGTIIVIPVFNVVSFIFNQRDLPDGRDLNRCFPGTKNGSLGSRIANDIMQNILPVVDFGVDFHTGGAKINNYPQLRCVFDEPQNMKIAKLFAPPFIINSPYRDGSFRSEAAKRGKSILVFEAGESLRFNKTAIDEGLNGC